MGHMMYATQPRHSDTASSQPAEFTQEYQGRQGSRQWLMSNALTPFREERDVKHSCSRILHKLSKIACPFL